MLVLCSTALAAAGDAQFRASDDFVLTGAQEDLIWQRMGLSAGTPFAAQNAAMRAVPGCANPK